MNESIRRALTGSAEHPELTFVRRYRASAEEVRSACTDPTRLARWLGEIQGKADAVGDAFTVVLGETPEDSAECRVLRCDDDSIAVSWRWGDEKDSTLTARITPVDEEHTTLTLHHSLGEPDFAVDYGGGWERLLQGLARSLDDASADAASDGDLEIAAQTIWRSALRAPMQLEQIVPASLKRVWNAFTTAEGLKAWWWSHWDDVEIATDTREGGRYRITAASAGVDLSGSYLTVEPRRHLAYTWCWRDDDGEVPDEAVDIRFDEVPGGTRVRIRHSGPWADDAPAESYRQGWEFTLGQLLTHLTAAE